MECDKIKDLMPFLDDGSLEPEVEDEARRHMLKCEKCRKEYTDLRFLLDGIQDTILERAPEPLPGYLGMVRAKIRKRKTSRMMALRFIPAAAAIIIISSVAVLLFSDGTVPVLPGEEKQTHATESYNITGDLFATYHLTDYDVKELVNINNETVDDDTSEKAIVKAILLNTLIDVTTEDIMDMMDDDHIYAVLASYER